MFAILASVKEAQKEGALDNVMIRLGPYKKRVNLKIPVAFIIGDAQGGDYIVGRSAYYDGWKAKQCCRKCDAGPEQVESTTPGMCRRLIQSEIEEMIRENRLDELKALYQYDNVNAFFDLDYGGSPFGIFTAAMLTEALHQLEKGLIYDCLIILFKIYMKGEHRRQLDDIVSSWCELPSQKYAKGSMDSYPRLLFRDGITTLTNITANTVVGIMFATVLASLTKEGIELMSTIPDLRYQDMLYTFESMLCFWAWLKKDKYWDIDKSAENVQAAEEAIGILMAKMKSLWPRNKGAGWQKPKFHETFHNPFNIHLFGTPKNWHSGPTEHNHVCHVKKVAKFTQKRREVFDQQLGTRLVDKFIIDKAYTQIQYAREQLGLLNDIEDYSKQSSDSVKSGLHVSGKYVISFKENRHSVVNVEYKWITKREETCNLPKVLIDAMYKETFQHLSKQQRQQGIVVHGFTEYHRNDVIFRAHPKYRNNKAWYDYAMVAWEAEEETQLPNNANEPDNANDTSNDDDASKASAAMLQNGVQLQNSTVSKNVDLVPCQIIGFIDQGEDGLKAIIHSCYPQSRKLSVLTNWWRLEFEDESEEDIEMIFRSNNNADDAADDDDLEPPYYKLPESGTETEPLIRVVSVDTLEKHCLMIPIQRNSQFLVEVIDFEKWSSRFLDE